MTSEVSVPGLSAPLFWGCIPVHYTAGECVLDPVHLMVARTRKGVGRVRVLRNLFRAIFP